MTRIVGFGLLASAFAPLVALLAVLHLHELGWAGWVLLVLCLASVLLLAEVLEAVKEIQERPIHTMSVKHADERVLAFTSSYIVPVVVALFGNSKSLTTVATLSLVVVLAIIYVRGGLYHLNPLLAILGFRLYEVTSTNGTTTMLLTRAKHLAQHGTLGCRPLSDDVAIQLEASQ